MLEKRLNRQVSARDALLKASKKLFAERGFEGVSFKDVGDEAGVNPALVCYHFKSKERLYSECLAAISQAGLASIERCLRAPVSREDFLVRFEIFAEEFVLRHLEEQDACMILRRDSSSKAAREIYKEHIVPLNERFQSFIRAAKKAGLLDEELDTDLITHLVLSTLFNLVTTDPLRSGTGMRSLVTPEKNLKKTIKQVTRHLLRGMLKP